MVHLRTCQTCAATLCSSPNRHATRHAHPSGHPVIASTELGEHSPRCELLLSSGLLASVGE